MEIKIASSTRHKALETKVNNQSSTELLQERIEKINGESNDLSSLSPMKLHSILLEAEKLGLSYSIEKSTVVRFN